MKPCGHPPTSLRQTIGAGEQQQHKAVNRSALSNPKRQYQLPSFLYFIQLRLFFFSCLSLRVVDYWRSHSIRLLLSSSAPEKSHSLLLLQLSANPPSFLFFLSDIIVQTPNTNNTPVAHSLTSFVSRSLPKKKKNVRGRFIL